MTISRSLLCLLVFLLGCLTPQQRKFNIIDPSAESEQQIQQEAKWDLRPFQQAYQCGRKSVTDTMTGDCEYLAENWLKGWVVPETKRESTEWITQEDVQVIHARCEKFWKSKTPFDSWCYKKVLLVAWLCGDNDADPRRDEDTQRRQAACNDFVVGLELQ